MEDKIKVIEQAISSLLKQDKSEASHIIEEEYPFIPVKRFTRSYTDKQKMVQYVKDGFIDRYSGKKMLNPGILRVLSFYLPETFPFQTNWRMNACHIAYWEYAPTVDHIYPIARGGKDAPENWATTSMLNNSIKSNWTLEELRWTLYSAGNYKEWDGLTGQLIQLVEQDTKLLQDSFIAKWYKVSKIEGRKGFE